MSSINKPAGQWTDEELLSWAKGETTPSGQASNRTVANEATSRFELEATSDVAQTKALLLAKFEGEEAPVTEPAVEEVTEAAEPEGETEVEGEPTPQVGEPVEDPVTPNDEEAQVVIEGEETPVETQGEETPTAGDEVKAPEPEVTEEATTEEPEVEAETQVEPEDTDLGDDGEPEMPEDEVLVVHTPTVVSQADMTREIIENNLAAYAKTMAPNYPTSVEEGTVKQVQLYRTIQTVLRTEGAEFFKNMDLLLGFIAANRTNLFTEARAYRFFDKIRLPANERKLFERLLNLFIGTAAKDTRQMALGQVNLQRTIEGLPANQQQLLIEFYSV